MTKRNANQISITAALAIAVAITITTSLSKIPSRKAQTTANANPASQEEKPFDQAQKIAELTKQIAGKENLPAEQVFKNIQVLGDSRRALVAHHGVGLQPFTRGQLHALSCHRSMGQGRQTNEADCA